MSQNRPPLWRDLPPPRQRRLINRLDQLIHSQLQTQHTEAGPVDERDKLESVLPADIGHRQNPARSPGPRVTIVYVRQSTLQQIERHRESTRYSTVLLNGS
jgi:hypothetical protein